MEMGWSGMRHTKITSREGFWIELDKESSPGREVLKSLQREQHAEGKI